MVFGIAAHLFRLSFVQVAAVGGGVSLLFFRGKCLVVRF